MSATETPQIPATKAELDALTTNLTARIEDARNRYAEAQKLWGTPAAQLERVIAAIGDMPKGDFVSIEILSPDKDIKVPREAGWGSDKTIGETGWTIRLSKSNQPFTVINQNIYSPPDEQETGTVDE